MAIKVTKKATTSSPKLKHVKGENFYRNAKQAKRAKLLTGGKAVRDKDGKIIQAAAYQKTEAETLPGRVQPDKRWFGNTRVISQTALSHFREALAARAADPYSVVLRRAKLPVSLLATDANPGNVQRPRIVDTEPFNDTFGPKAQRKRPRIDAGTFEELAAATAADVPEVEDGAAPALDDIAFLQADEDPENDSSRPTPSHPLFAKGTSRRIHGELHKVIDSSDVIVHVVDARDPLGTRCDAVVDFVRKDRSHKQLVFVLNKCDLVPAWVAARWLSYLSKTAPTLAFHASLHHSFGKGSLIQLLRQFSTLHSDRKQISVGFIGYPNVGKSSIINCLRKNKVCTVAPIPGETKVWQYITLTKKIYLIDCPGIVPISKGDSETDTVLKGVIRLSALPTPSEYIPELLGRVRPEYLGRTYGVPATWTWGENGEREGVPVAVEDADKWLEGMARKTGKLLKGGEPDRETVSRMVLGDWQRGRLPFFTRPPPSEKDQQDQAASMEKAKEKEKEKGKGKAKEIMGVEQKIGKFAGAPKWLEVDEKGDGIGDAKMDQEEDEEAENEVEDEEEEDDEEREDDDDDEEEENEDDEDADDEAGEEVVQEDELPLSWEEALGTVVGPTGRLREPAPTASAEKSGKRSLPADDDEDESTRPKKTPRMTTNKRKPQNFFSTTNVKNKNRDKKRPRMDGGRGRGRRR